MAGRGTCPTSGTQFIPALGDPHPECLRLMAVSGEDLPHQIADVLMASFVEEQERRTGAAQRAAEQSRRSHLSHFFNPCHESVAIRLMQAILKRGRKCGGGSG